MKIVQLLVILRNGTKSKVEFVISVVFILLNLFVLKLVTFNVILVNFNPIKSNILPTLQVRNYFKTDFPKISLDMTYDPETFPTL